MRKTFPYSLFLIFLINSIMICSSIASEEANQVSEIPSTNITATNVTTVVEETSTISEVQESPENKKTTLVLANDTPSAELVRLSWEASGKGDLDQLEQLVSFAMNLYGEKAKKEQVKLKDFPARDKISEYGELNDIGTILFIEAEAFMHQGKTPEAITKFQNIIDHYKYAQAWDPRGWYWSVAEKSQASINVLTGKATEGAKKIINPGFKTSPHLEFKGTEKVVDYTKYGKFLNVGTKDYHYTITDLKGLSDAVGEGIYPNISVRKDPNYQKLKKEGRLEGSHWDYVHTEDLEAAFYKWATAPEAPGVKLFYLGLIFEHAKMYYEAIKTYHALIVHYPKDIAWTYWQTPWYPGQVAIAKIRHLIRLHPELGLKSKWMKISVKNGFDNDPLNDEISTLPGVVEEKSIVERAVPLLEFDTVHLGKIKKTIGTGTVHLVQYENGHWQMLVDGQPFVVKGVTYGPAKVGQSPDKGTLANWMLEDENKNGRADGPYDAWVDKNGNNKQDEDEPTVGDFALMRDLGINAIRIYHDPTTPDKKLLREMFENYGIRVIMGDFLGKYAIGSGASWFEGTDYENPKHRESMLANVKKMVMEFKDEPYILLWVLGNENNYGVANNADKKPDAYYQFLNEVAKWIKSVDPNHPVAVGNGDTLFLDKFAQFSPEVDIFGANVYRGDFGFGSFWEQVFDATGKPGFITEFGCPAYAPQLTEEEAEVAQEGYHLGNWLDVEANIAGRASGVGNALGGIVFEWVDEWWKSYEPGKHDTSSDVIGPFPGGFYYEEWFGLLGQGDGSQSPFLRKKRKVFDVYKELWHKGK